MHIPLQLETYCKEGMLISIYVSTQRHHALLSDHIFEVKFYYQWDVINSSTDASATFKLFYERQKQKQNSAINRRCSVYCVVVDGFAAISKAGEKGR